MENDKIEKIKGTRRFRIALLFAFFSCVYVLLITFIKGMDKEIIFLVTGYVFGMVTSIISFYFGSSEKEDKQKEEEIK